MTKLLKKKTDPSSIQDVQPPNPGRRSLLQKLGLAGIVAGFGGMGLQAFRSLIPNVTYESPRKFKIGAPEALAEGMTFLDDKRLYVFREGRSFYAVSGACTHLGCTVKYVKLQQTKQIEKDGATVQIPFEFHCPCHGSKFYADGSPFAGPAPGPLKWYRVQQSPDDGQLIVDLNDEVEQNSRFTV
jgi:menaquinol-cytochrome c reductase iron-sulfur subunit